MFRIIRLNGLIRFRIRKAKRCESKPKPIIGIIGFVPHPNTQHGRRRDQFDFGLRERGVITGSPKVTNICDLSLRFW